MAMMATMVMKHQQQQQQQRPKMASPPVPPVPTTTQRIITKNRILLFLALSIALVSCSQIVFLTPTIDQNQQWTPRQQHYLNMKNTKKTKIITINRKEKKGKGLQSSISSDNSSGKEKKGKGNKKTKTHQEEYLNQRAKYTAAHVWELHHGLSNTDDNNSDSSNDDSSNSNGHDNDGNNSSVVFVLPDVEQELEKEVTATAEEPWLVVHIGPPKTATTTIQCGLEKYALRLAMKDNYHFVGGGCGIADQEYLMPNAEETVLRRLVISTLHELEYTYETTPTENDGDGENDDDENSSGENSGNNSGNNSSSSSRASSFSLIQYSSRHHNPEFQHGYHLVKKMLQRMSYLRQRNRSVILSGEQFGSQLSRRNTVMTTFHSMFTDGTNGPTGTTIGGGGKKKNPNIVNNIIDETTGEVVTAGFPLSKIRIVLAYRHFVDWLPSYYYQNELVLNNQMDKNWILHGPHSEVVLSSIENQQQKSNHTTTTHSNIRHRHFKYQKLTDTQLSSIEKKRDQRLIKKSRVQSFLDYAEEYLSNWELHATDIINWMDTIKQQQQQQQTVNGTSTNSSSSSSTTKQQRRSAKQHQQHMLEMLPKDRHAIHPSWWLYTVWSSHFPLKNQVQVYDMHSPMNMKTPNEDMFTDFICHMVPSAHSTCQTLISSLEENKKKKKKEGEGTQEDTEKEETEFNYEEPLLHSSYSFLHPGRTSEKLGFNKASSSNKTTDENENSNNNNDTPQSMIIRPSSNHHATRIVEELLVRGVIQEFTYNENNKEEKVEIQQYFQEENAYYEYYYSNELKEENNENDIPPPKPFFIGLTKPRLVEITNALLEQNGILVSSSTSSSTSSSSINSTTTASEPFSEKYFDCMSPQLEQRLLNASWTFMDLMYRHTPMLALATAATFPEAEELPSGSSSSAAHLKLIQQEKQKRWKQAKLDHARLFQKNKQKGKYCDINLDKVLQHNPRVAAALSALQFKPSYLRLTWHELPPRMQQHAILLGYTAPQLWNKGVSPFMTTLWKDLAWPYKVAAFQLGWEMERWDGLKMK